MTEEVRDRIKNWIASEVAASESPRGNYAAPQKAAPLPETPLPAATILPPAMAEPPNQEEAAPAIPESAPPDATAAEPALDLLSSVPATPATPAADAIEPGSQAAAQQSQESSNAAATPAIPSQTGERRLHARRRVKSLSYIELGQTNGGIVINMSEDGLQVQAAVALTGDRISLMRFQLPQSGDRIEAGGKVAWTSESQKEAGIQFVDLPEEERAKLREWVASEPPSTGIHAVKAPAREKSAPLPELPKVQEPGRALRESGTSDRPVLRPQPLIAASSPLAFSPLPQRSAKVEAAAQPSPILRILKPTGAAEVEPPRKTPHAWMNLGMERRTWEIIAGVIAVVSTISFTIGWIAARRSAQNAMAPVSDTKEKAAPREAAKSVPSPPASAMARPPSGEGEKATAATPPPASTPAPATKNNSGASSPTKTARVENEAPKKPAASPIPSAPKVSEEKRNTATGATQSPVPLATANIAKTSTKNSAAPSAQIAVAQPTHTPPAAPVPTPDRPAMANAPPAAAVEKATAAPAPTKNEPEIPAIPSGAVAVSLPPFPSIRVPAELKAQSSKLGTSLRIGQLVAQVTPLYPEDMRRQRVEGIVKLHVIVGKDGVVRSATLVSGPPMLAPPAINAILQWRYAPTLFGGQEIEVEEDITVIFRLKS